MNRWTDPEQPYSTQSAFDSLPENARYEEILAAMIQDGDLRVERIDEDGNPVVVQSRT